VAVLEVSSFQLDHVRTFRPTVSVILNITPDHLDRYGFSFERYVEAKCRVFANQREGDTLVYNRDDAVTAQLVAERVHPAVRLLSFGMKAHGGDGAWVDDNSVWLRVNGAQARLLRVDEVSIRGTHNLHNAMAAVLGGKALWLRDASMRATLKNFKGVEHRLEFVRERDGVVYINDSKATNVDSVWYALQSFSSPIVLLLGGRDKGNDYSRLTDLVRQHVKQIIAIGESAEKVVGAFTGIVPTTTVKGMDEAVGQAAARAAAGDVVLLSPACASFDWFDNYEHRGRVFKKLVMDLPQGGRQ
jgi:UDP-N-acetylmuramoylalanine--D-glutamate ligase